MRALAREIELGEGGIEPGQGRGPGAGPDEGDKTCRDLGRVAHTREVTRSGPPCPRGLAAGDKHACHDPWRPIAALATKNGTIL
jgi:hypothetical protein